MAAVYVPTHCTLELYRTQLDISAYLNISDFNLRRINAASLSLIQWYGPPAPIQPVSAGSVIEPFLCVGHDNLCIASLHSLEQRLVKKTAVDYIRYLVDIIFISVSMLLKLLHNIIRHRQKSL